MAGKTRKQIDLQGIVLYALWLDITLDTPAGGVNNTPQRTRE
jgi:hypothetical protein